MYQYGKDVPIQFMRLSEENRDRFAVFDCGETVFNTYVHDDALSRDTTSYVFFDVDKQLVVAYASIACSGIMTEVMDIEAEMFENTKTVISAIEVKYFAVNAEYRSLKFDETSSEKQTLSFFILSFLQQKLIDIAETIIAAKAIVLYAIPKSKTFYERCGFKEFEASMTKNADHFTSTCTPMFFVFHDENR